MNIIVTGAAGLIGGEVCARLMAQGHSVTAMVHRNPDIRDNNQKAVAVSKIIKGDVTQARFGWDDTSFTQMATDHDMVIHCAATVRFDLDEDAYYATNVSGTRHALTLAEAGDMDFLHVSTAYVCGIRDGRVRETDALPVSGFANGYEASKAQGERLVQASNGRWAIARPSIVTGAYDDGAIRQFDTTYAAFKLIAEGRIRQMPATQGASLDFVPVDHVAAGIVTLAQRMDKANGGVFHLVSAQPLPVPGFTGVIGEYAHFHEPELVDPDRFDPASLPPLERRLFQRIAGVYASYFQRSPHFDDTRFRDIAGYGCEDTGAAYIRRLIDYCMAAGFLPDGA